MLFLIADSSKSFRARLREIVSRWSWVDDVVEADEFARMALEPVDLAVIAADLPGLAAGGIADLRRSAPDCRIIIVGPDDAEILRSMLGEGAVAYIRRNEVEQSIRAAVQTVRAGGIHVPPLSGLRPVKETLMTSAGPVPAGFFRENAVQYLTRRQCEVLAMIRDDWSNTDIAEVLGVTVGTVKIHITAIFKALGVRNRVQARVAAERLELPNPPPKPQGPPPSA